MSLYNAVYLEVNLLGIILTAIILIHSSGENHKRASDREYTLMVVTTLVALVIDGLWTIVDGVPGAAMITINNALNAIYMILTGLVAFYWLKCVLYRFEYAPPHNSIFDLLIAVPQVILVVLSASSPFTHWIFYIDEANNYMRGSLLFIQQIICYGYMIAAFSVSVCGAIRAPSKEQRMEAINLAGFAVLPAIGSIINVAVFGMPSIWPFVAVSLILVYVNSQSMQISTDSLTGLNNRRKFDKYIVEKSEALRAGRKLFLILMDIDDFKCVNDSFGHQVGDRALYQTADILKAVCDRYNCFLARYGGDEFAIVFDSRDTITVEQLKDDIDEAFGMYNDASGDPYNLSLSMGMSEFHPGYDNIEALIKRADGKLYEVKNTKRLSSHTN